MKREMFRALVDRVVHGDGVASVAQRARAFQDGVVVGTFTDEEIVELEICAAVGRAERLYAAGLAALEAATDAS